MLRITSCNISIKAEILCKTMATSQIKLEVRSGQKEKRVWQLQRLIDCPRDGDVKSVNDRRDVQHGGDLCEGDVSPMAENSEH